MKLTEIYTYFGVNIFRSLEPGYKCPYIARLETGESLASFTLSGMKALIKQKIKKG